MNDIEQLTYLVRHVATNVLPSKIIGEIHDGNSISEALDRQGFTSLFSLLVSHTFGSDQGFESKKRVDFIVGVNPFETLGVDEIKQVLGCVKQARLGSLLAIQTEQYCDSDFSGEQFSIEEWLGILEQFSNVVHVYDSDCWSVFLTIHDYE